MLMLRKIVGYTWAVIGIAMVIFALILKFFPQIMDQIDPRLAKPLLVFVFIFFLFGELLTVWEIRYIKKHGQRFIGEVIKYDKAMWRTAARLFAKRIPVISFKYKGKRLENSALNISYFGDTPYKKNQKVEILYAEQYPSSVLLTDSNPEPTYIFHAFVFLVAALLVMIYL